MSDAFEIFSVPGQIAGLDGHVGNADFSLNIADWSEENENDQYMPAEEFDLTPGDAVQHRAQGGDGAQVGIRHILDLDADALTAVTEGRLNASALPASGPPGTRVAVKILV